MSAATTPQGLFVTGTGTSVGKTILAAALLASMSRAGLRTRAHKPVVTGTDEPPPRPWPHDHVLLASMCGLQPEQVSPARYGPAVSPHLASALAGIPLADDDLLAAAGNARADAAAAQATLIVEGVGGLLVPLTPTLSVRDFARACALPILIATRPGLGTINHTLLTLEAARAAELDVRAVVITPWPAAPSTLERSNRETIEALGNVQVALLPRVEARSESTRGPLDLALLLAAAGDALPWRDWM